MTFDSLDIPKSILSSLDRLGYKNPTPIQAKILPILIEQPVDIVGIAQTGTGKTAAFAIPLLCKINARSKKIQAIVLTPTRELAKQVATEIAKIGADTKIVTETIVGGVSYDRQFEFLKKNKPQIIVATPGRLIDLLKQKKISLEDTDYIVLDEADQMLNMGFWDDVTLIFDSIKGEKFQWLFSATLPKPIESLIKNHFNDPLKIKMKTESTVNANIEQSYYLVKKKYHYEALRRLITTTPDMYAIVFCRTKLDTKELADRLMADNVSLDVLHGDFNQSVRTRVMNSFKAKKINFLICTDVAARGIDVNDLTHVINYVLLNEFETYIYRIGRIGRAGNKGEAISIIDPRDQSKLKRIEKFHKTKIELKKLPSADDLKAQIVASEMDKVQTLIDAVKEKGESFKVDNTFEQFGSYVSKLKKDELLKVFYSILFKKRLSKLDDLGSLNADNVRSSGRENGGGYRGRSGGGGSRGENRRSGGRSGGGNSRRRDESTGRSSERKRSPRRK